MAVTNRRALRANPQTNTSMPSPETVAKACNLLEQFMYIAQHCPSRNPRAKTYAEVGLLVFKMSTSRRSNISKAISPQQFCDRALKLDDNDSSVFCKCGRLFRYLKRHKESHDLLKKAVSIWPSSAAHHHLGPNYAAMANNENSKALKCLLTTENTLHKPQDLSSELRNNL